MQSLLKIGFGANALAHFMAMMSIKGGGTGVQGGAEKLEKCVVSKVYFSHIFLQIACDFYLFARRHLISFFFFCVRGAFCKAFFRKGILYVCAITTVNIIT